MLRFSFSAREGCGLHLLPEMETNQVEVCGDLITIPIIHIGRHESVEEDIGLKNQ